MAETGKLIDADALVELLQKWIEDNPTSYFAHEYKYQIAFLRKASDASEPLRKRIAELEGAIQKILKSQSLTQTRPTQAGRCDAIHELAEAMNEAESLLKGGQDA